MHTTTAAALVASFILLAPAAAHSWVQQLTLIDSTGMFTGTPGYARNYTPRSAPGFTDKLLVHLLPPSDPLLARDVDTEGIKPTDAMCRKSQQEQFQSDGSPRLSATPGSMIALRYEENGHVTLPENQPGKPANRGNVFIYGTSEPKPNENFLDVFKQWNAEGTGGDKRGKLLATQPFDDGRCFQVNGGPVSTTRQKEYPHTADKEMGMDIWCQNDIKLPSDLPTEKPYTLYWVWDWPTEAGKDPGLPKGKAEIYTSCMDIDIKAGSQSRSPNEARDVAAGNVNNMAIPSYMSSMNGAAPSSAPAAQPQPSVQSTPAPNMPIPQNNQQPGGAQPAQPPNPSPTNTGAASSTAAQAQGTQAATASVIQTLENSSAKSMILSALGPQLISEIAAEVKTQAAAAATVTISVNQGPVGTGTPPAQNSAASNSAAENTATGNPSSASTSPPIVASLPPTSLNLASPIMSPTASGAPTSAAPAQSGAPTLSGTATPVVSGQATAPTGVAGKRSCTAETCRKVKRSRIFGAQKE